MSLLFDAVLMIGIELPLALLIAALACKTSEFTDAMKYINPADQAVANKHIEKMDNRTDRFVSRALVMIFNDALEGEAGVKSRLCRCGEPRRRIMRSCLHLPAASLC